jgi:hypothetical protein
MFGDKLLPAECSQLVDHLKRTLLCFQVRVLTGVLFSSKCYMQIFCKFPLLKNTPSIPGILSIKLSVFQCAHGRPTMVPLVNIQALHKRFDQSSGINRSGANGMDVPGRANASRRRWHGLKLDVKSSLERAQARLAQARGV